jgi:ABC-type sugar transport system permease subunit
MVARRGGRGFWGKYGVPYLYISPFYILWAIFGAFPIAYSLFLAFHFWNGLAENPKIWVGLENFVDVLKDKGWFWKAVYNTLYIGVVAHIPMLTIAMILAFLLNSRLVKFRDLFRTTFFMPVVTAPLIVGVVFGILYGTQYGIINWALNTFFGIERINWFGGTGVWIKPAIIILLNWRWIGWNMIIYLAGLQAIPNDLYEAAAIDGASFMQVFWHISLPLIKPVILFTLVLSTIGTMQIFDEPFILVGRDGGLNAEGLTLSMYIFRSAFRFLHFGPASAASYLVAIMIIGFSVLNIKLLGGGRGHHEAEEKKA